MKIKMKIILTCIITFFCTLFFSLIKVLYSTKARISRVNKKVKKIEEVYKNIDSQIDDRDDIDVLRNPKKR